MSLAIVVALLTLALGAPAPAHAHGDVPAALRDVGFDQHLDARVPMDLEFRDERGAPVSLHALLADRPAVLTLNQYRCPRLCPFVLEGLARVLGDVPLVMGRDYVVITIGIDPREGPTDAAAKKAEIARASLAVARSGGWHFLTGSEGAVRRVASAVGFRYTFDRAADQYAHPTGLVVLTPRGYVARYVFGMDYLARDLRLSLVEAARGRIGSAVDDLLLTCYRYDATTGRYTPRVMAIVRASGAATVVGMGLFLFVMFRAERRRQP